MKDKLKNLCELVDVDKFCTSKLCYHCHGEMAKVRFDEKEINGVLHCSNNKCGITMINGRR